MSTFYSIRVHKLSKRYKLGQFAGSRMLRESLVNWCKGLFRREKSVQSTFWALKDISIDIKEGEVLGIIGRNGAGKSTLLKVLSKITFPTSGSLKVNGRVASLLEVGTGFHDELTGRENIFLNGSILGMGKKEIQKQMDAIVSFAGVERFIDTPIKRYSSGMRLRLGFAVAAHLESDILIVDEVLAVGDAGFQKKCLAAMGNLRAKGKTVLFVSHNMLAVENLCSRVIWIDNGQVKQDGEPKEVINAYMTSFAEAQTGYNFEKITSRRGSGDARLTSLEFLNIDREPLKAIRSGDRVVVRFYYNVKNPIAYPIFVFRILTEHGMLITELNTWSIDFEIPRLEPGVGSIDLEIEFLNLMPGRYFITLLLADMGTLDYDVLDNCGTFMVEPSDFYQTGKGIESRFGLIFLPFKWAFNDNGGMRKDPSGE